MASSWKNRPFRNLLRRRKAEGEERREWHQMRFNAGQQYAKDRAADLRKQPRGVDRVPAHLKVVQPEAEKVIEHTAFNHRTRRLQAQSAPLLMPSNSEARTRKLRRRQALKQQPKTRAGGNTPYYSPDFKERR